MDALLFMIFAAIAVVCAINLVVQTHPISSALSLVGVMGALAALYLLLGGEFIAAAQLMVYAGAIMVLFVFVIMLLNAGTEHKMAAGPWAKYAGRSAAAGVPRDDRLRDPAHACRHRRRGLRSSSPTAPPLEIGRALFTVYLLPFEVTSVLILIAILGAIVLARKEID